MKTVLTALTLLALAAAPALAETVHASNVRFFWSTLGDQDALQPATMPDGRIVTLAQAVDELATRAGEIDLRPPAVGPGDGGRLFAGDIWLLAYGPGPCEIEILGPGNPMFQAMDPNFWIYEGDTATMSGSGYYVQVINWLLKESGVYMPGHWSILASTDHYCVEFGNEHIAFPFLNGLAEAGQGM